MTSTREPLADRLHGALAEIASLAPPADLDAIRDGHRPARGRTPVIAASAAVAVALTVALPVWLVLATHDDSAPQFAEPIPDNSSTVGTDPVSTARQSREDVDAFSDVLMGFDEEPGFGRVIVDYRRSAVTLLWKGAVPAAVEEAIARAPSTIVVETKSSIYSSADLAEAGMRVLRASRLGQWPTKVVDVVPNRDLSGVIVHALEPDAIPLEDLADVAKVPVQLGRSGPINEGR